MADKVGFTELAGLSDPDLQTLLRGVDLGDLAVALWEIEEESGEKIRSNLPARRRNALAEEMALLQSVPPSEVEAAQRRILQMAAPLGSQVAKVWSSDPEIEALEQGFQERTRQLEETHRKLETAQARLISLQTVLREVDLANLVRALKAAEDALRQQVLSAMPDPVRIFVTEEMGSSEMPPSEGAGGVPLAPPEVADQGDPVGKPDLASLDRLSDLELQTLLREVEHRDMALALTGIGGGLRQRILANMARTMRTSVTEEIEHLGPAQPTAVEAAQWRILEQAAPFGAQAANTWSGDQKIEELEQRFQERTRQLEETHRKLEATQGRLIGELEKELQVAHEMQMRLMPKEPPQIAGFEIAGLCMPNNHVGGDLFQYFHQNGKFCIGLADVTGHAMAAAIPVVMFSGILKSQMGMGGSVEELLFRLNQSLYGALPGRTFICFALGELDLATGGFRFADAGCPYPYHFQSATGTVSELQVDAYPLGVRLDTEYRVVEVMLGPGDRIVFCSDGIIEAANAGRDLFGFERTAETIRQGCQEDLSAEALLERIMAEVKAFGGDIPQADDQTVVVLRVGDRRNA